MKNSILLFFIIIGLALMSCQQPVDKPITIESQMDKVSYGIGQDIGNNFKQQGMEINPDVLAKGIIDVIEGNESMLSESEIQEAMSTFQEEMMAKRDPGRKEVADSNKKAGEDFLAANRTKEGVITTDSGLQYKVLTPGTGRTPKPSDTVETHYRGTLIDGKEFDSSYKRGESISFPVQGVIAGWTEALLLMKEGAKWQLFIPSDLAYGPRGAGPDIGPNSTLIFDIELISIK